MKTQNLNLRAARRLFLVALLTILTGTIQIFAADGDLDTTFSNDGKVITDLGNDLDAAQAVALQSDGKIVAAGVGGTNGSWVVARFNTDGTLDTTFGSGGKVSLSFGISVSGVHIRADGKIVVTGDGSCGSVGCLVAAQFNSNGSLDTSFGAGGAGQVGVTLSAADFPNARASILQPDGKIIFVGDTQKNSGDTDGVAARVNANGSLDNSFGTNGVVFIDFNGDDNVGGAALQPDGKIVVAGSFFVSNSNMGLALARLTTNGSLDTSFGSGGKVARNGDFAARDVVVQADGRIVAAGENASNFVGARFNADGTLDTSFATGGKTGTPVGSNASVTDMVLQADGKFIISGVVGDSSLSAQFTLVRYNINGSLDTSFSSAGIVKTSFAKPVAVAEQSVIQPDGKIVTVGYAADAGLKNADFALARYLSGGQTTARRAPADFNGDGKTDFALVGAQRQLGTYPNPFQEVWYIQPNTFPNPVPTPPNATNYQVPFGLINPTNQAQSDFPVPEDFDGDGKADIVVWRPSGGSSGNQNLSYFYVLRSSDRTFSVLQFGQPGDSPRVSGDYDGDGKADQAVYRRAETANATDPCGANNQGGTARGAFYFHPSASPSIDYRYICLGLAGDISLKGDFNSDGRLDYAVQRAVGINAQYFVKYSSSTDANLSESFIFGYANDIIVPGDYDGDGKTDIAAFRQTTDGSNNYSISTRAATGAILLYDYRYGLAGDIPVPGDYNGDGKTDIAVYRQNARTFFMIYSGVTGTQALGYFGPFGTTSDLPVAAYNAFNRAAPAP